MEKIYNPELIYRLAGFSRVAGVFSVAIGCLVLSGWILDINLLKSVVSGLPTMKANTAVCFVLSGFSLLLWQHIDAATAPVSSAVHGIAIALSTTVTFIAAITLGEYLFEWTTRLDELVIRVPVPTDAAPPGRMSLATAFNFLLIGIALLLLSGKSRFTAAAQIFAAAAMTITLLALLAYQFNLDDLEELYKVMPFSSVAIHTVIAFFILGAGVLTLRADHGWVSAFTHDTVSARLGRRFLMATLLVLPLISELRIIGQEFGLYGVYFGIALFTASSIIILSMLNWFSTRMGNIADQKISNHIRVYAVLSGINTLIVRAHSEELLFRESCRIARETGLFPWVWIATIDPDSKQGNLVAWQGADAQLVTGLQSRLMPGTKMSEKYNLIGQVVSTKAPVILDSLDNNPDLPFSDTLHNDELRAYGIHSLVALPLIVSGTVVGVFTLHAETPGFFDETEMRLLTELAGDIAFAINNIQKEAKLDHLTYYDTLTNLPNSTLFLERLEQAVQEARSTRKKLAVIMFDIERFKTINDAMGRAMGDELLRQVAMRMREFTDVADRIARLSADRFAVFVMDFKNADAIARKIEQRLHQIFATPFMLQDTELRISAKCGVAMFPDDSDDAQSLFKNAEAALKKAKISGERYVFYIPEMTERVAEQLALENKLLQALEKKEFVLHYQPKVDTKTRRLCGVEALIRWQSPELGLVPPMNFIPLMEETGMILEVGAWALRQASIDYRQWTEQGLTAPRIAVNVSPIQLRQQEFSAVLQTAITESMPIHGIDLEITESLIMENVAETIEKLQAARASGMDIAVDDFGTGYSSLRYLAELPVQTLKIDRSFIITMLDDPKIMNLVSTVISLAHSLKLKVVAEGVDSVEQEQALREMECDQIQGYLISKPVPWARMVKLIAQDMKREHTGH